jgi:hypothetical protein
MTKYSDKIKQWFDVTTYEEQHELAEYCGVSRKYLWLIAIGHNNLQCTAQMAIKLETATRIMHKSNPLIPILKQIDVCRVCAVCPYAR